MGIWPHALLGVAAVAAIVTIVAQKDAPWPGVDRGCCRCGYGALRLTVPQEGTERVGPPAEVAWRRRSGELIVFVDSGGASGARRGAPGRRGSAGGAVCHARWRLGAAAARRPRRRPRGRRRAPASMAAAPASAPAGGGGGPRVDGGGPRAAPV